MSMSSSYRASVACVLSNPAFPAARRRGNNIGKWGSVKVKVPSTLKLQTHMGWTPLNGDPPSFPSTAVGFLRPTSPVTLRNSDVGNGTDLV